METKNGFSLIEILVVVGIMGVLAAAGVASYNKMNDRAQVEQAAQMLATELRTIQKRADSGVNKCPSPEKFLGVEVSYVDGQVTYKDKCASGSVNVGAYELSNGTTLSWDLDFVFNTMSQGVSVPVGIVVTKGEISYEVEVNSMGGISVAKSQEDE